MKWKKTYFVNANLVWNLWCDSKIQIYLVYMFLIYQIHEMQTMRLNRKSLLQIIYLNSFWIQPVNAIRIMLVFTLLVQNYSICKIILFIQFISVHFQFQTQSSEDFIFQHEFNILMHWFATWFVFHCKFMSWIFLFWNQLFKIDCCLK